MENCNKHKWSFGGILMRKIYLAFTNFDYCCFTLHATHLNAFIFKQSLHCPPIKRIFAPLNWCKFYLAITPPSGSPPRMMLCYRLAFNHLHQHLGSLYMFIPRMHWPRAWPPNMYEHICSSPSFCITNKSLLIFLRTLLYLIIHYHPKTIWSLVKYLLTYCWRGLLKYQCW